MHSGINIYSGEPGLGGALTNPTQLAKQKGCIQQRYPVNYKGRTYPDAEIAYHALKTGVIAIDDLMMTEVIACKFRQHEKLLNAVLARGGSNWLASCSHITGSSGSSATNWEGAGLNSRFIRNIVSAFDLATSDSTFGEAPQFELF